MQMIGLNNENARGFDATNVAPEVGARGSITLRVPRRRVHSVPSSNTPDDKVEALLARHPDVQPAPLLGHEVDVNRVLGVVLAKA